MKNKKILISLVACLLCFSMAIGAPGRVIVYAADDEVSDDKKSSDDEVSSDEKKELDAQDKQSLKDLNSKMDELEKKQQEIQKQINSTKSEKDKQLAIKQQIGNQIDITKSQIGLLSNKIGVMEQNIVTKEEEIAAKQIEIDDNMTMFKKRMRANYMAGESSNLAVILGAKSFAEVLMRARVIDTVAGHDQQLLAQLTEDKANLERLKKELDDEKEQIELSKQQQDAKRNQLDGQMQITSKQIQDIAQEEQEYAKNKAEIDKMMAQAEAEVAKIYAKLDNSGTYDGGKMAWPVPGYTQISSPYGMRFSNTNFHTGMDITGGGVFGHNIVAAADGTVFAVQYMAGGYGKYLIIDHGGGVTTLYGHTSEINVSVGQKVTRGMPIAKVGSTGWSTGPHLHFEVRINGKHTNPAAYVY
ncbi:MAG: peptidoglycan DD-metalloendopeptidase family protein [Oscillospiraceae bacterium]